MDALPDDTEPETEYKIDPAKPELLVGLDGTVWRKLNPTTNINGYQVVTFWNGRAKGNKASTEYVHRLVLETFVRPSQQGEVCRHLDGDPANNHIGNLTWGTSKENAEDRMRHGTVPFGVLVHSAKLDEEKYHEIHRLAKTGMSQREIGEKMGVHQMTISNMLTGKTWAHMKPRD